jgi:hypothetical protein
MALLAKQDDITVPIASTDPVEPSKHRPVSERPPGSTWRRSGDSLAAVLLIGLGLLFLLNNFGVLPWGVWGVLWRFWPLFLVLLGIRLLFGRSRLANTLVTVFGLLIIIAVLVFAVLTTHAGANDVIRRGVPWWPQLSGAQGPGTDEGGVYTEIVNQDQHPDASRLSLEAHVGAGEFTIEDASLNEWAILEARFGTLGGKPTVQRSVKDRVLQLKMDTEKRASGFSLDGQVERRYEWRVNQDRDMEHLVLDLGAGKGLVDFSDIDVGTTNIKVGAGKAEVVFRGNATPVGGIWIDVGAGTAILRVPKDAVVQVRPNVGLGKITVNGKEIDRKDTYNSGDIDAATKKIFVNPTVGAGSVEIFTDQD